MPDEAERPVRRGARAMRSGRARGATFARILPFVIAAAIGIVVGVVVLVIWFVVRGGEDRGEGPPAAAASIRQLNAFASAAGHPVYWAGSQPKFTYELSSTKDGRIYIRYLPPGADIGDPRPNYLTVGTYPQEDAFETLQQTVRAQGVSPIELPGGGLAFQDKNRPTSVYLAYPGSDYQVEVYAPSPGTAGAIVASGQIKPLGTPPPTPAPPARASVRELKRLAAEVGHPIYWAGEAAGTTYELTRTGDGSVYIRYLPAGVELGARRANYLTIGTYPQEDAFQILKRTAARNGVEIVELANGGRAFVDDKSVYVAYPNEDIQIEVYDPVPGRARELVTSGDIVPVQ